MNNIVCENCGKACKSCGLKDECQHYKENKKPVYFNGMIIGYKSIDLSLRQGE